MDRLKAKRADMVAKRTNNVSHRIEDDALRLGHSLLHSSHSLFLDAILTLTLTRVLCRAHEVSCSV